MDGTSTEDRKKELAVLLKQIEAQPSRDWTAERERVRVLTEMIAASERSAAPA
jgi:hypothetical protein